MRKITGKSRYKTEAGILATLMIVGLALSCAAPRAAAQGQPVRGEKGVAELSAVVNFKDMAQREALAPSLPAEQRVVPFMPMPTPPPVPSGVAVPTAAAPAVPPTPSTPSPSPAASFAALGDNDLSIPPDTMGTVGPNHLMVTLNTQVRIQDRSGNVISTVSLPSFWSSTGAVGPFDPHVVYDPFNSRWIFVAFSDAGTVDSSLLLGVTQTSDPTGAWTLFRQKLATNSTNWLDYPMVGFNNKWVVVGGHVFTNASNAFVQENIYVFNKANLYAVSPSATFTLFTDANGGEIPAVTYDNSLATMYLVQNWNGNSGGSGFLRLSTITGSVGSEAFTPGTSFPSTANPWASTAGSADFAPQSGTSNKIQNNDSRIINAVYRNGSIWAAQSAFLPAASPTRTAAQWWQIAPNGTVQQFGRVDDPNGNLCPGPSACFYAFPSIAVNAHSDVLLGYSSFSSGQFAAADYSLRLSTDTASTLRSDVVLKAGEAVYFKIFTGTKNRWGDYSSTVVDPVNDLDMWTIQEYASSPNFGGGDNRWGTWWGKVTLSKQRHGQLISE